MITLTWDEYHARNAFTSPDATTASSEYIFAYPVNWSTLDVRDLWTRPPGGWVPREYAIYIHFPFCRELCPFCTFCHVRFDEGLVARFLACLKSEILTYAQHPAAEHAQVRAVYFGGGTGSLIPPQCLADVLGMLADSFSLSGETEVTVECHPLSVRPGFLAEAAAAGVNRVTFGIQTFSDSHARTLGIRSRSSAGRTALDAATALAFSSIGIDLIYGIPGQSVADFLTDVRAAIDLGANHVSLYCLDVEGTKLESAFAGYVDGDVLRTLYYRGRQELLGSGFEQQAQPDFFRERPCTFVDNAWAAPQGGTIGFGAGAVSFYNSGWTYVNTNDIDEYIRLLEAGRFPVLGGARVSERQLMTKYAVLGFRCLSLPADAFMKCFGIPLVAQFPNAFDAVQRAGWVKYEHNAFRLTEDGLWFVDNVSRQFYDDDHRSLGQPWAKYLARIRVSDRRRLDEVVGKHARRT